MTAGTVTQGEAQAFQPGYALDWFPVRLTPGPDDPPFSADDPWRLRVSHGTGDDTFVEPSRALDGDTLVLSHTFTPEETRAFAKRAETRVTVEYGPAPAVRPRLVHRLVVDTGVHPRSPTP